MTNEAAEQLREEIERIVHRWKYTCTIPHEDFEEIINKVLDVVSKKTEPLERVSARLKAGGLDEWSHKAADGIICSVLQNIKTLRP